MDKEIEIKEKIRKSIINRISKTITENAKSIGEFSFGPSVPSKIKSLKTIKYDAEKNMM